MKLHRVSGENLASLAAPFEVWFDEGPLAQVGLFAITGPTGAGKSTVLDAICLALFDETPRLNGTGGVEVGEGAERYKPTDPRNLVRRGSTSAFAEVEFTATDGLRYAARWSVRKKPRAGGLDDAVVTLRRVGSSEHESGRKKDTLARIEALLGLNAESFSRAVLLAQGEFARLLHAKADERGNALEWITRSELYSNLSRAAHKRGAEVEQAMREQQVALKAIVRLSPEERADAEAEVVRIRSELPTAEAERVAAEQAASWAGQLAELAAELLTRRAAAERAEAERQALAPLQAELAEAELAATIEVPLRAAESAERAASSHLAATPAREAAVREAEAAAVAAAAAALAKAVPLTEAESALVAQEEPLRQARQLDAELVAAGREAAQRATEHMQATSAQQRAETAHTTAQQAQAAALAEGEAATKWLTANPVEGALAPVWSAVGPQVEAWATAVGEAERAQGAVEPAQTAARAAAGLAEQREAAATALAPGHAELAARLANEAGTAREAEAAALRERRNALETLQRRATSARELHTAARAIRARQAEHTEDSKRESARAAESAGAGQRAVATAAELQPRLDEAQRALRTLEARRDLSSHRAELREGEACPLCGALEHPLAGTSVLDEVVADATARCHELATELSRVRGEAGVAEAARAEAIVRADRAAKAAGLAGQELAPLAARWSALSLPGEPAEGEGTVVDLDRAGAEEATALRAAEAALAEAERAYRDLVAAEARSRTALEAAQAAGRSARAEADRLRTVAERAAEQAEDRIALRNERQAGLAAPLAALADWPSTLAVAAARTALAARVQEAVRQRGVLEASAQRAGEARTAVASASAAAAAAKTQAATAGEASAVASASVESLRARRAAVLAGEADAVEAALKSAVLAARTAREAALAAERLAVAAVKEAVVRLQEHTEQSGALISAREEAEAALAAALASAGLSREQAAAALARGAAWRAESRRALEGAAEAVRAATQAVTDREARYAALSLSRPPGGEAPPEERAARVKAAADRLAQLHTALGTATHRITTDDEATIRHAALQAAHGEALADADAWRELKDTIGSADGKILRGFAQSLTLARLLDEANVILGELAPRYQLERVPGQKSHLELQVVDRERGSEVRAVNTLSGGETFLLSLAMALGLSAVAARRQPINCLFIDEGFGTLDPASLDQALGMLEALQHQGRTIGIISHVPGLSERVGAVVDIVPMGIGTSRVEVRST